MTDHWYLGYPDRRQNRRLDDLESDVLGQQAAQRSQLRTLENRLAKVRGSLEQRVEALAQAMGAFVELTDVREELREFQAEAAARKAAVRTLAWLSERSAASAGRPVVDVTVSYDCPDVEGYWLPAAAEALVAAIRDDHSGSHRAESRALERDPRRSALFLCLGLLLAGRPDLALDHFDQALALRPTEPITHAQRFLWRQAAAGAFGKAGRLQLERNLTTLVEELPADEAAMAVSDWQEWLAAADQEALKSSTAVPANVRGRRSQGTLALLGTPAIAARQLDRLHAWVQARLGQTDERWGDASADPSADPGPLGLPDDCPQLLHQLIAEGSASERPLLQRYDRLRAIVDANTEPADAQEPADDDASGTGQRTAPWDRQVGLPREILHQDAVSEPGDDVTGEPERAACQHIALQASRPLLLRVGNALTEEATSPMPGEIELQVEGHAIRFDDQGPTGASVNRARETVEEQAHPVPAHRMGLGWTIVIGSAVLVVIGLLSLLWLLVALGLVGLGVGGWRVLAERASHREENQQVIRRRWSRLAETIDRHGDTVTQLRRDATNAAAQAAQTGAALTSLLNEGSLSTETTPTSDQR